jgi:stage II sporulation protein D
LQSVEDAPGIRQKPGGTWGEDANISSATIKEKLRSFGIAVGSDPVRLEHLVRGPSGRTWRVRVILNEGSPIDLDLANSKKLISLFGRIRSSFYELQGVSANGKQAVVGHGYGHGVGMSQWGAQIFATQGWAAEKILQYYYTRVEFRDLASID